MKKAIIEKRNDPRELEKLYRSNKTAFKEAFISVYPQIKESPLAEYWNERLNYSTEGFEWGTSKDLFFLFILWAIAGLIAKLPALLQIEEDYFYARNIGFIIFPALTAYFIRKNQLPTGKILPLALGIILGLVFINLFPDLPDSDTLLLSSIHMLLFLWVILGWAFKGRRASNPGKWLEYLKYNGDTIIMTALILMTGGLLTALTIGLFTTIGIQIETFYFNYIGIFGLCAAPIAGTYLTQTNPQLVGKVSPVIAKIFSPLVLVMLLIYLLTMIYSGKDPYNDREFLLIFNGLLIGVMAIIFFSVSEIAASTKHKREIWVLLILSLLTLIVNGIALSAILFRISEWGITPNRAAVLGGNVLILIHLLMVTFHLYRVIARQGQITQVGKAIGIYIPVYFIWSIIVTFLFPWLFGFG
ncbi:hypothetical protein [Cyclobacterium sp.]|uniref:hypothetical protein n=1 Tax=Cyclobacterium sp. TaxID=1966343 RepID=UPI001989EA30|nr:hypothetical protein [Cyclobacterium sp.]MBD3627323.1 hypothetical protein [Cyclobacterium sp.]